MTHERHADFLQDMGLHQAGVERMAEVVKADVANSGGFDRGLPATLHDANWLLFVGHNQSGGLATLKEKRQEAIGQGNFPRFPFWSFRARNVQYFAGEVDIFPALAGNLAAPHSGV